MKTNWLGSVCAFRPADLLQTDWNIPQWHKLPQTLVPVCVYATCILGAIIGLTEAAGTLRLRVEMLLGTRGCFVVAHLTQRKCCRLAIQEHWSGSAGGKRRRGETGPLKDGYKPTLREAVVRRTRYDRVTAGMNCRAGALRRRGWPFDDDVSLFTGVLQLRAVLRLGGRV